MNVRFRHISIWSDYVGQRVSFSLISTVLIFINSRTYRLYEYRITLYHKYIYIYIYIYIFYIFLYIPLLSVFFVESFHLI